MKDIIRQLPTFVNRTYHGGLMLGRYLGFDRPADSFKPEDWISSFTEAKNRVNIENEGITRVAVNNEEKLITDVVTAEDFGEGRLESGVLIKFLDAAERLGIQVHPTREYAKYVFGSEYGKTECWHILDTRNEAASVYIGFKENVTKEFWRELFLRQDAAGMLDSMHRFKVKAGDTILITGGTPHAIGAGCFMLEIQEPTDYTMRVEKVTVAGETLTPTQIHYGVGEETMLECFSYIPRTRKMIEDSLFLKPYKNGCITKLVGYSDTPCFALDMVERADYYHYCDSCTTLIITDDYGVIESNGMARAVRRGDKFFVPARVGCFIKNTEALICYPPKIGR